MTTHRIKRSHRQRCRLGLLLLALALGHVAGLPEPPGAVELAAQAARRASLSQPQQQPADSNFTGAVLQPLDPTVAGAQGLGLLGEAPGRAVAAAVRPPWLPVMQARTTPPPACSSLKGSLDECCNCSYEEVDQFNEQVLFPTLAQLVATPFFRYFKVNLYCDCPLWPDDSMCALRACSVCECPTDELPKTWLQAESSAGAKQPTCGTKQPAKQRSAAAAGSGGDGDDDGSDDTARAPPSLPPSASGAAAAADDTPSSDGSRVLQKSALEARAGSASRSTGGSRGGKDDDDSDDEYEDDDEDGSDGASDSGSDDEGCDSMECAAETDGVVDRGVEPRVLEGLAHLKGWRGLNNPWMAEGEEDEEFLYINLIANPERYTGYRGEHAHRIWSAIYNQSCFTQAGSQECRETRLFYRLISGMHTSISAHIAAKYLIDEEKGIWGPSPEQFRQRLGTPVARERVKNLYFAYLFVLRAVSKAAPLLSRFQYDTGMPEEDARTTQMVQNLLSRSELPASCFVPFEPSKLWQGAQGAQLLGTMQATFRNITRIMDCVGCEKCKLWGKLQTLGIATALKILFSSPDCDAGTSPVSTLPTATFALQQQTPQQQQQAVFPAGLVLERNEVIALVNLLERFATSLHYYRQMDSLLSEPASKRAVTTADIVA